MLTDSQNKSVKLLFQLTDAEVARKLKISQKTLETWKSDPEFSQAIKRQLVENRRSAVRMLSRLYTDACKELDTILKSDDHKDKPKVIIEILKASGLFKELGLEDGDYVGNLLEGLADENEETERGEET